MKYCLKDNGTDLVYGDGVCLLEDGHAGDCVFTPESQVRYVIHDGYVTLKETCTWTQIEDDGDWDTSCGDMFILLEGSPKENDMKFCCYCGLSLVEKLYEPEPENQS